MSAVTGDPSSIYTRQSSGLVRSIGTGSNLILNLSFISIPLSILVATLAPYAFPNSSLIGIVLITAALCIVPTLLYGMLSQAMPRSGGDYVFVSRILGPAVGFVANFSVTMWFVLAMASIAALLAPYGISAAFTTLGAVTDSPALTAAGTAAGTPGWTFAIAAVAILLTAALMSLELRTALKVFRALFLLSLVGVAIAAVLTLTSGREAFEAAVARAGGDYDGMIRAATRLGYTGGTGFDLGATIAASPLAFASFGYAIVSTYAGGEIRAAVRTVLKGLLAALAVGAGLVLVLLIGAVRTFGETWLGAASFLATEHPAQYPLPAAPFYFYFTAMLTTSPVLIVVMFVSLLLAVWVALPPTFLITTRCLFAWSFDRVLPARISEVNRRTHSPLWANGIIAVLGIAFLALIVFGPAGILGMVYAAAGGEILTFIVVAIAAALLPFRRRELWEASPIARRIAGVPTITVVGVAAVVVYLLFLIPLLTNGALGANAPTGLIAIVALPVIGAVVYGISWAVNRSRGIDLALAFRMLPPE